MRGIGGKRKSYFMKLEILIRSLVDLVLWSIVIGGTAFEIYTAFIL